MRWLQMSLLALVVVAARPATAEDGDAKPASSESSSTATSESPEESGAATEKRTDEEILALYQRGKEAYKEGDYEGALALFSEFYEHTGHPALLFNMAQAHRLAGPDHCLKAHDLYVEYLVQDAEAPNSNEVRERIKELKPCARAAKEAAEKAAEESQVSPVADDDAASEEKHEWAAPAVTITAGVALLTGIGLFTAAKIRYADAQEECPCEPGSLSQWETMEKVGVATMAVGGAGVAAGGVWWWASANPRRGEEAIVLGVSGVF